VSVTAWPALAADDEAAAWLAWLAGAALWTADPTADPAADAAELAPGAVEPHACVDRRMPTPTARDLSRRT